MIRVRSTVRDHWSGVNPGVIAGMIDGAAARTITARTRSAASIRFAIVETTRHARAVSSVARSADTIGITADDRAPAATSWNTRSGRRNAAKNASRSAPGKPPLTMTTTRTQPRTREMRKAPETISPARARAREEVTPGGGPAGEGRPAVGEIDVERRPGRPSQQADPLLAALAEDPDLAAAEVQGRQLGGG